MKIAAALKEQLQESQGKRPQTVEISLNSLEPGDYIQTLAGGELVDPIDVGVKKPSTEAEERENGKAKPSSDGGKEARTG